MALWSAISVKLERTGHGRFWLLGIFEGSSTGSVHTQNGRLAETGRVHLYPQLVIAASRKRGYGSALLLRKIKKFLKCNTLRNIRSVAFIEQTFFFDRSVFSYHLNVTGELIGAVTRTLLNNRG